MVMAKPVYCHSVSMTFNGAEDILVLHQTCHLKMPSYYNCTIKMYTLVNRLENL